MKFFNSLFLRHYKKKKYHKPHTTKNYKVVPIDFFFFFFFFLFFFKLSLVFGIPINYPRPEVYPAKLGNVSALLR